MKAKRTSHFIQDPSHFDISCAKCKGHNTTWSEYEGHLWCYDCNDDIELTIKGDIFPVNVAKALGIDLRRWDMINKCIIEI